MTEKVMEWWLRPIWYGVPYPDGSKRMMKISRQAWASYLNLLENSSYSIDDITEMAEAYAVILDVPYGVAWPLLVQHAPPNPKLFRLPRWAKL